MDKKYDRQYLQQLASKWKKGTLTEAEQRDLDNWESSFDDELLELPEDSDPIEAIKARMFEKLRQGMQSVQPAEKNTPAKKLWLRIAVAASIVMALGAGLYFYEVNDSATGIGSEFVSGDLSGIKPGKNSATLTLSDGQIVQLSDVQTGVVVETSGLKYNDGSHIRSHKGGSGIPPVGVQAFLTATTPHGGQYQVTLPDGTRVWLNAASILKFPARFTGNSRKVELIGEGYFEVAKITMKKLKDEDKTVRMPFVVISKGQQVEVLGTHFNISAYEDEASIKTTLLEGAVRVKKTFSEAATREEVVLKPGQQSVLAGHEGMLVKQVDVNAAVAWKNGDFEFKGDNLQSAMKKIARWYNVEVVYEDSAPKDLELVGWVSRKKELSAVLKMIASTKKVHFIVEGRRVFVKK